MMKTRRMLTALLLGSGLALAAAAPGVAADKVKAGVVRSMGGSPNFIGKEKGFFAEQGIDVDIVFFDSAQPIAIAVASGDCDVGATGVTAAFFNLASQGTLRIVASGTWEKPEKKNQMARMATAPRTTQGTTAIGLPSGDMGVMYLVGGGMSRETTFPAPESEERFHPSAGARCNAPAGQGGGRSDTPQIASSAPGRHRAAGAGICPRKPPAS